jgi:SAM-dependent methyltransferase
MKHSRQTAKKANSADANKPHSSLAMFYAISVMRKEMFEQLERINERPAPFEFYTAGDLWTDEHTSEQMLIFHLNEAIDVSSRNAEFINRSVEWIASRFKICNDTVIADFGCGPGLYAARLAKRGANVTGIDFSGRSIEYAKAVAAREQLKISYVEQNYLEFETQDRFDFVLMIMCDFCALSPTQRKVVEGFTKNTFTAMIEGVRQSAVEKGIIDSAMFDKGIEDLYRTTEPDGTFCYTFFKGLGKV